MGMYNTVWVPCPHCGKRTGFQEKFGHPLDLKNFQLHNAPIKDLCGILGDILECDKCHKTFKIQITYSVAVVACPPKGQEDEDDAYDYGDSADGPD